MRGRRAALHALVGPYVLDAVSSRERADFERHVLTCDQCRDDITGLREAAGRLAAATAMSPRPELREQTVTAAERIRQLPPVITGGPAAGRPGWRAAAPQLWRTGSKVLAARPWLASLAAAAVTALALTAIVLGVHLSVMQSRMSEMEQRDSAIATILASHDATTLTAQVRTGGMASVVMSHRARALVFMATGLRKLPASKAYELWLMSPTTTRAAGMLSPDHHGISGPVVVRRLVPGDMLGLTIEPSAGTGQPTSAPVVMVALGS